MEWPPNEETVQCSDRPIEVSLFGWCGLYKWRTFLLSAVQPVRPHLHSPRESEAKVKIFAFLCRCSIWTRWISKEQSEREIAFTFAFGECDCALEPDCMRSFLDCIVTFSFFPWSSFCPLSRSLSGSTTFSFNRLETNFYLEDKSVKVKDQTKINLELTFTKFKVG